MINKYFKKINSKVFEKFLQWIFDSGVTLQPVSISNSVAKSIPNLRQTDFVTNLPLKINYKLIKRYFKRIDSKIFLKKCDGFSILSYLCGRFLLLFLSQNLPQICDGRINSATNLHLKIKYKLINKYFKKNQF